MYLFGAMYHMHFILSICFPDVILILCPILLLSCMVFFSYYNMEFNGTVIYYDFRGYTIRH